MAHSPDPSDHPARYPISKPLPESTSPLAAIGTRLHVLANGLTVLVHEDNRFPLASMRLFVRAGSVHEAPEQAGISHLLEHMVFKGTSRRLQGQAAADIESFGGELNAATGFDATMYIVDLPAEHWATGLDVIQDMIFNASFAPEELESERQVILAEMDQGNDDPHRRIFKSVQERLWAGTAYARPIIGYPETVCSISRDDLSAYVRSRYQPANMTLVLCGDVRSEDVLKQAELLFGHLTNHGERHPINIQGSNSVPGVFFNPDSSWEFPSASRIAVEQGPWQKAHFFLALPIPGLRDVHSVGLDVLAHMLGGDRTSLLYRRFKYELGLVDTISVSATTLDQVGMLSIQAQLDAANVEGLWSGVIRVLADLTPEMFSPEALDRAKLNMEDSLFQAKETLSGMASKLGYFQFHEQNFEAEQLYLHMIRTMDAGQLQEIIQTHIRPERLVCSIFTPTPETTTVESLHTALEQIWPDATPRSSQISRQTNSSQPEILHLAPGRTLVLLPDRSLPYTALTMCWNGGDLLLPPRDQGLSELTARVWTKGTRTKNAVAVQDFLADRAARVAAGAGLEQFHLSVHFPARFSPELLGFFQELVQEPAWASAEVDRAKQEQCAAIVRAEDSPVGLALRNTFPFLFPKHPYGYQRSGTPEAVTTFTQTQIVSFWDRQQSRPWVMAACGDLDREALLDMATNLAGQDAIAAPAPRKPQWGAERELLLQLQDRNQSHILVVFPLPGVGSEQTPGLNLLREVLAGQSGLLFRELRDVRGLAYSVTALLWQETLAGFLAFYIGTSPDKEEAAIQGFQDVVRNLAEHGVPETALHRAQNLLWGDYQRGRQRLIARAHEASENLTRGFTLDHSLQLIEQAKNTPANQLSTLIQEHLHWDKAYLIKVRP
ncbi:M16 family metallopeptidase [Desulfonatronum thioautotrophicum]|uniref:M16 family metallopeptidase n=1 Tax=Desulfonatronum thioautotrophicum TaxID=617001 RepID=UPI000A070B36|nr:pitrilysin family protein [Desulfonatronum thioautotrophicum]